MNRTRIRKAVAIVADRHTCGTYRQEIGPHEQPLKLAPGEYVARIEIELPSGDWLTIDSAFRKDGDEAGLIRRGR